MRCTVHSMTKQLAWLLVGTVLFSNASCDDLNEEGRACTTVGCGPATSVTLTPESGVLPGGTYLITVDLDGDETACSFNLPDDVPESGEVGYIECAGDASQVHALLRPRAGANNMVVELNIADEAPQLGIEVTRDGQSILSRQLQPSYTTSYPNGPECSPACPHADISLTLGE